jgi:hypothetical protein
MVYLGETEEQIAAHRSTLRQWGRGSSHVRLLPNRKNLLKIDWEKLWQEASGSNSAAPPQ